MVSVSPKHIAAFILGTDRAIYRKYKDTGNPDTTWTGWVREAGTWIQDPVTISRVLGEVNIFMVDVNHNLQQSNFNFMSGQGLSPWKNLGGKLHGTPAVANSNGTIHIFHIGTDRALYHKAWDGVSYTPDEGYEKLGGVFIHTPAAVSTGTEEVSVFAVGLTDGCLHHYHWTGSSGWEAPAKLPGLWAGTPCAISDQEGCWDVFGINPKDRINHVSRRRGVQSDIQLISGQFTSVDAVSWGPGRIDLFGHGLDSAIFHKAWANESWGGWENLEGGIIFRPTPVSHSPGALCVIAVGTNSIMYIKVRDPNTGIWGAWVDIQGIVISRAA